MHRMRRSLVLAAALACGPTPTSPSPQGARAPALHLLGTAQDGGLPHAACTCDRCARARADPGHARRVASVAIVADAQAWLIDATPDLPDQLDRLAVLLGRPRGAVDRAPLAGLFVTHAHMGHYLGLAWLGFEAVHTRGTPLYVSPTMARFLADNAPWDQLIALGNVDVRPLVGDPVALVGDVRVTAIPVPHRAEYTDTLGFVIAGPHATVLYVPDSAPWSQWSPPLPDVLAAHRVTVALLDATFNSADELPGRDLAAIAHPLMSDTMDLLQPLVDAGRLRVVFTHLNHSNPAVDPASPAAIEASRRGFEVAVDGLVIPL
jgi:pyrroloquinoline quinone biosynthesis protein B